MIGSEITARGIRLGGKEVLKGNGINVVNGHAYIYVGYAWHEVEPESVRVMCHRELKLLSNPQTTQEDIRELQDRLVQCAIDFCKEKGLSDIDGISFGVDGLQDSVEYGKWGPGSDSSIVVTGLEDGLYRREIGENM